ncbi:MAG TPA: hypothetical protein VK034_16540 [Enhygromyxa sp.]|nr:hypothetical protein [Enhygromyxa sp.]
MRSSSVRTAALVLTSLVLAPAVAVGLGCGPTEQPAPKKLERQTPFDRGRVDKRERDPNDPVRNPAIETPAGRDGPQVSEQEIDAALAEADEFAAVKNVARERIALRKCANKTPASARCDGRMGLSLIPFKNHRATALYYLNEAAQLDDPRADAALYVQIGQKLASFGQFDAALAAMDKAIARDSSAENLFAYGQLLSLIPERLVDSADRMAEARSKDDRIEWLLDEAVVRGQIPIREQAERSHALFKEYIARAESAPAESLRVKPAEIERRLAELEAAAKIYPTAAEYEQLKSAAAEPEPEPKPEPS